MASINVVVESHLGEFKEAEEMQIEQALIAIGMVAETYAKEGCPVDNGRLMNDITHDYDSRTVAIGTNVEYGKWVELGHHQQPGRYVPALGKALVRDFVPGHPFLGPAVEDHSAEYRQIVEDAMKS